MRGQLIVRIATVFVLVVVLFSCGFLVGVVSVNPELRANSAQVQELTLDQMALEEELREVRDRLLDARARLAVHKGLVWELLVSLLEDAGIDSGKVDQRLLQQSFEQN